MQVPNVPSNGIVAPCRRGRKLRRYGVAVGEVPDPLPRLARPLHWDEKLSVRVR